MYPEFIPIYVGLVVIIGLLITILIFLLKRTSGKTSTVQKMMSGNIAPKETGAIVFCKNCATQFDASQRCCPKCGAPR